MGKKHVIAMREATTQDWDAIWPLFRAVVSAGDTYAYCTSTSYEQGRHIWLGSPRQTWVCECDNQILGTYYIKTNQAGPGDHVCNCGYMVSEEARGKGIATHMCEHSQHVAANFGYKAMQFNFVASSNVGAVGLWHKLGFETVGRLPKAFAHPHLGYVDALVMFKWLSNT